MAVSANWRGHGVGTALAEECIDRAKLAAGRMVWCSARESAFGFYRGIGFELVGELYDRADIIGERYARMAHYLSNGADGERRLTVWPCHTPRSINSDTRPVSDTRLAAEDS
jgi:ribosomal protein S18 acetylase RimI-like enzyme